MSPEEEHAFYAEPENQEPPGPVRKAPEPQDAEGAMAISMRGQLARLAAEVAAMTVADNRMPEEILGYDDFGLPH